MRSGLFAFALVISFFTCSGQAQDLPQPEQLLHFAPERVEVTWGRDGWALRCGEILLKDFGRRNTEAGEALRLIRDMGLTERGVIGGPTPVLEYWLCNGKAPTGTGRGQRVILIDQATLKVDGDGGQWCVRDADRVLFNFGYAKPEAEQTLAVLKKYQFSRLLLLGQGAPSMMVFLHSGSEIPLGQRHTLSPLTIKPNAIRTSSFKQVDEKKEAEARELAAIQSYATPSVPPLMDTTRTEANRGMPMTTVPGITDRITRVPLDSRQAQLRQDASGWGLHLGSLVVARFGRDEQLARKGLQALQHYRFNELSLVGSPRPVFAFLTTTGQLPRGELFGIPSQPLLVDQIKIQAIEGRQALVQGTETLVVLGERVDEARQLLDWIQRHKPDRLCRLTTADGNGMVFFAQR